jgi:hypothetical protein
MFTINVKRLKESKPEIYEKWKLVFLIVGEEKENIEIADINEIIGWIQTKEILYDASEGLFKNGSEIQKKKIF